MPATGVNAIVFPLPVLFQPGSVEVAVIRGFARITVRAPVRVPTAAVVTRTSAAVPVIVKMLPTPLVVPAATVTSSSTTGLVPAVLNVIDWSPAIFQSGSTEVTVVEILFITLTLGPGAKTPMPAVVTFTVALVAPPIVVMIPTASTAVAPEQLTPPAKLPADVTVIAAAAFAERAPTPANRLSTMARATNIDRNFFIV